jgi:hypothetical protein
MVRNEIPVCPLISIGSGIDMVCSQSKCAWYVPNVQKCSMYLMGYNALLDANIKQRAAKMAAAKQAANKQ